MLLVLEARVHQVLRAAQAAAELYCSGLGAGTGQHGRDGDDGAEDDGV